MYDLTALFRVPEVQRILDALASKGAREYADKLKSRGIHAPTWEKNFNEEKKALYDAYLIQLGEQPKRETWHDNIFINNRLD